MLAIDRVSGFSNLNKKSEHELIDQTHARLVEVAKNEGKRGQLHSQFYVTFERKLKLVFYIDGEEVEEILFDKEIKLTESSEIKLQELKAEIMTEISKNEAIKAMDENDLAIHEE